MDVNYSRWMSKDPDAEPEVVEDEPRRFRLPWPTRSAVASTAMVSLIVLGGGAFVRSIATPEVSADQAQTIETPAVEESIGPGAASVDDSMSTGRDRPAPTPPRLMDRRELHQSIGVPPGEPWSNRPPRGDSTGPALPPPMLRP